MPTAAIVAACTSTSCRPCARLNSAMNAANGVDARTLTDRAVSPEPDQPGLTRIVDGVRLQLRRVEPKGDVHRQAAVGGSRAPTERGAVDRLVQLAGLCARFAASPPVAGSHLTTKSTIRPCRWRTPEGRGSSAQRARSPAPMTKGPATLRSQGPGFSAPNQLVIAGWDCYPRRG